MCVDSDKEKLERAIGDAKFNKKLNRTQDRAYPSASQAIPINLSPLGRKPRKEKEAFRRRIKESKGKPAPEGEKMRKATPYCRARETMGARLIGKQREREGEKYTV